MIRWERQEDGGWQGFSGELLVATVTKDEFAEREQWLWSITALKRPKGWRKGAGHRTSWIDARRAAEEYWAKWLEQAALRADVMQLASRSSRQRTQGPGLSGILCAGPVDHHARTNLSSNMMANWVFASPHSRGDIFHSAAV